MLADLLLCRCSTGSVDKKLQLSHGRILVYSLAHQDVDLATGAVTEQNKIEKSRVSPYDCLPPKKKPSNAEQYDSLRFNRVGLGCLDNMHVASVISRNAFSLHS